jgi:hypothetical protein
MLYTDKQGCIYLKIFHLGLNKIKWGTEYEWENFQENGRKGKERKFQLKGEKVRVHEE